MQPAKALIRLGKEATVVECFGTLTIQLLWIRASIGLYVRQAKFFCPVGSIAPSTCSSVCPSARMTWLEMRYTCIILSRKN